MSWLICLRALCYNVYTADKGLTTDHWLCFQLTKSLQQCAISLNIRDMTIVERTILVPGGWGPRFWWVFIYKHDVTVLRYLDHKISHISYKFSMPEIAKGNNSK